MNNSKHILLVDDSTTVRMIIAAELREAGFRVTPVPTLDGARRALGQSNARSPFDLAILDLQLPDGDGIDLLREIRRDPSHASLPVMILSSDARFTSRVHGLGVGADDFVGKPHSKAYLVGRARLLTGERAVEATSPDKPWRVLVVDTDAGARETLAKLLRVGHGCDVVALENVDQAAQYIEVEGRSVDGAVVERRSFLRMLGLLQDKRPEGAAVVVLDDSPSATWPPPASARRSPSSRAALVVPRSLDPSTMAEAVVRRLIETSSQAVTSSGTILKSTLTAARRFGPAPSHPAAGSK